MDEKSIRHAENKWVSAKYILDLTKSKPENKLMTFDYTVTRCNFANGDSA